MNKIIIREHVYRKFMHFVDKAPGEVSGMGAVEIVNGVPVVTDVWLVKQKNSDASTELDGNEVARLMFEHRDKDLRWWVHSHAEMSVFWSGTDEATIKEFGEHGWLVATVMNKKREMKSAIYQKAERKTAMNNFVPEEYSIFERDVETIVLQSIPEETIKAWDKEFEDTCSHKSYVQGSLTSYYSDGVWNERRQSPVYQDFIDDKCCNVWEDFLKNHSDLVAKRMSNLALKQWNELEPQNIGEVAAQSILDERALESPSIKEVGDYETVRDEVIGLYEDGMPLTEAIEMIDWIYGGTWTWVCRPTFDRLNHEKGVHDARA
jgi:hypothetical protein